MAAASCPTPIEISNFYNAVQWAAGLELFLLINDPMQVFFTTDHPNGAPFTTYPELFALLMSADLRAQWLSRLPAEVLELTDAARRSSANIRSTRSRTMTPRRRRASSMASTDRGSLGAGSVADVAVYKRREATAPACSATRPTCSRTASSSCGTATSSRYTRGKTLHVQPAITIRHINKRLDSYYDDLYGLPRGMFDVPGRGAAAPGRFRGGSMPQLVRKGVRIDDSFAEAFPMSGTGLIITAPNAQMGADRPRRP